MDLKINITTDNSCTITITDESEWLDESRSAIVKDQFRRSHVTLVDALTVNKIAGATLKSTIWTEDGDTVNIPVSFDGYFTVTHMAIPNRTWLDYMLSEIGPDDNPLDMYDTVYYTEDEKVYRYYKGEVFDVDFEALLEVNLEGTNLSRVEEDYVSICYMRTCYINYCKQILNNKAFTACFNTDTSDTETRYKRDLVHMAINVISYLVECNQLVEAERIIETIDGCNGLCPADESTTTNGCGCAN